MPNNPASSTLETIKIKVRRLTQSPSTAQLTDDQLEQYINTFVVYDFPEALRLFNYQQEFTFVCNPYQDTYELGNNNYSVGPLANFNNNYLTINPPVYVAGFQAFYTQSQEQFFNLYPNIRAISPINTGAGGDSYAGFLQNGPVIMNTVLFESVTEGFTSVALQDVPVVDPITGFPTIFGNLYDPNNLPAVPPTAVTGNNFINYATGQYSITFINVPGDGIPVNCQYVGCQPSRPLAVLFYNNSIILRPVPDQAYEIQFQVFVTPANLLQNNSQPLLNEFWQYIAYGAAKKIFEDKMDLDSVQMIMPEFKQQERYCLRRTLTQLATQRTATIYSENNTNGGWWWGIGGPY